jgi:hypothetical protein
MALLGQEGAQKDYYYIITVTAVMPYLRPAAAQAGVLLALL